MIQKSGVEPAASFSGSPQVAAVAFGTLFTSLDYSVTVDAVTTGGVTYQLSVESKAVGGFTINLGSADKSSLVEVGWQAFESES